MNKKALLAQLSFFFTPSAPTSTPKTSHFFEKTPPVAPLKNAPDAPSTSPPSLHDNEPQGEFAVEVLQTSAELLLKNMGYSELAGSLKVLWNHRLSTTAGLACYRKRQVLLNPRLIQFGMPEVDRTLRHELAHLVARFRAGKRRIQPHGAEWRAACIELGLKNEKACHNLPLPRKIITRRHIYVCKKCKAEVRRVRPFKRPVACLKCCRAFSNGRYDERFRLVKAPQEG